MSNRKINSNEHNGGLPPPVTVSSSKANLWAELQAARSEADQVHRQMLEYRDEARNVAGREAIAVEQVRFMHYQLGVIRAAVAT